MKFVIVRASAFICVCLFISRVPPGFGQSPPVRNASTVGPTAAVTAANTSYCFARDRGLDPGRLPPSYLVLKLAVSVSYRNSGTRPLILPLERTRTIYAGLNRDEMKIFKEGKNLFEPVLKVMRDLPPEVSPDSPVSPKNDVFTVIPAGGEMTPPLSEEITIPVIPKGLFKQSPDLRGHKVYIELRFVHRELSAALEADLSDRWSRFGVPWTGILTTNKIVIDVPDSPQAQGPCVDTPKPAHPGADPYHVN